MRLLRIYLLSVSAQNEISVEIFSDFDLFFPRFEVVKKITNPKIFVHAGFSRPSDNAILKLFNDVNAAVFFTNSARVILDRFIRHFGIITNSIDGESLYDSLSEVPKNKPESPEISSLSPYGETSLQVKPGIPAADGLLIIPNWAVRGNSFVWFKDFAMKYPDQAKFVTDFGITNDLSYQIFEERLDSSIRLTLAKHRSEFLLPLLKLNEVQDFCRVIPPWGLQISTSELNFSVRTSNRLAMLGIKTLGDFSKFSNESLMRAPGFGMKSLNEVRSELTRQIEFFILANSTKEKNACSVSDLRSADAHSEKIPQFDHVRADDHPNSEVEVFLSNDYKSANLLELLDGALTRINANEADVFRLRLGIDSHDHTLQEVGDMIGVSRARVGQLADAAKRQLLKIVNLDEMLVKKLDDIRKDLIIPLQVESLSNYDPWFIGVEMRPWIIKALLNEFDIKTYRVHEYEDLNIVAVGSSGFITDIVKSTKAFIKSSLDERISKAEIRSHINNQIAASSPELVDFILSESTRHARFVPHGDNERLVAFGYGAESLVMGILEKSESPIRAEEVLRRIEIEFSQSPDLRRVRNACADLAFLFAPSTFGLRKHLPFSDDQIKDVSEAVLQLMSSEAKSRQWHTQEIVQSLPELQTDYDPPLNQYTLGICMDLSEKFIDLGRMVYTLDTDGSGGAPKRIEFSQFIEAVLERSPVPLHRDEIIKQVTAERGLSQFRQIFQFGKLVKVATNVWALIDKHLNLSNSDYETIVTEVAQSISSSGYGLTQQELIQKIGPNSVSSRFFDNPFILESLALKSKKCKKLDDFIFLSEWEDCRRTTFQAAVNKIVKEMPRDGLSIREVMNRLNDLYDQPYKRESVNPSLRDYGASYDENSGKWRLVEESNE